MGEAERVVGLLPDAMGLLAEAEQAAGLEGRLMPVVAGVTEDMDGWGLTQEGAEDIRTAQDLAESLLSCARSKLYDAGDAAIEDDHLGAPVRNLVYAAAEQMDARVRAAIRA